MSAAALQPEPSLSDRLGRILCGLRERLAVHAARDRALAAMLLVLWNRLSRTMSRFAVLAARPRAAPRRSPGKPRPRREPAPPPPRDPLPRQRGWLVRRVQDGAAYGEYLRLLLDDPQMQTLLAERPEARRLLRPLWRMLRFEPPPAALRPEPAPTPQGRKPRQRRMLRQRRKPASRPARPGPPRSLAPARPAPSRPPIRRFAKPA